MTLGVGATRRTVVFVVEQDAAAGTVELFDAGQGRAFRRHASLCADKGRRTEIARMTLRTVRLELARCRDFPEGSPVHGYEFVAPLDAAAHFDAAEWKASRDQCMVRRFWGSAPEERGVLVHARGKNWAFSYVPDEDEDDEPIFKFDRHVFKQGEYVSVTEHDGVQRTFRVAAVR